MKITNDKGAQFQSEPKETKWIMLLIGLVCIVAPIAVFAILNLIAKNPDTLSVAGLTEFFGMIATIKPKN
jgi:hypothetical protein